MNVTAQSTAHPEPEPPADRAGLHRHRIDTHPGMWKASTLLDHYAGHSHPAAPIPAPRSAS